MRTHKLRGLVIVVLGTVLTGWATFALQTRKVDDNALKNAAKNGEEWLTVGRTYSEQRYSPLKQIDDTNVSRLGLAWSAEIGTGGGPQQGTPLAANGVLYTITNWSITFAFDARTGKEIWKYDPKADRSMNTGGMSRLCCGVMSRGIALYEGKVIVPVIDGRLEALDAATGKLLWSILAIPKEPEGTISSYSITMAPGVFKDKVIIGMAGAEFPPFRGYFAAFDVNNGKELWRFYTVPGDPSKPFENPAMEKAARTWSGDWYKYGGGGSIWDGMAYDPDANLLYVGTGNGAPWPLDLRSGKGSRQDNLYIASIVAVNPDNGQMKWHYQCTPGDQWDYDAVQHLVLADIRINGRDRKVIMQANKNGYFYVLDRVSGEFISGEPFALVSWASGLDPVTGRPKINDEAYYSSERGVTVAPVQGHGNSQMAFNPNTGLVYFPGNANSTFNFTAAPTFQITPGAQGLGLARGGRGGGAPAPPLAVPPSIGPVEAVQQGRRGGILSAWDPATQKERWFAPGGGSNGGGVLTTAGNLVFQAVGGSRMVVYSADKGVKLAEIATGQGGGIGPPMTYMLDGKQYVAVMAGQGAGGRGGGGGGGGGAPPRGGPGAPGPAAPGAAAPSAPAAPGAAPGPVVEPTAAAAAAAAQRGQGLPAAPPRGQGAAPAQAGAPAPQAPPQAPPMLPRIYVYVLDGKAAE